MDVEERIRRAQGARQDAGLSALACTVCAAALTAAPAPAEAQQPFATWKPDVKAATAYARTRPGTTSFAVRAHGRVYGRDTRRAVPAASTLKAMLMVAYLKRAKDRPLTRHDRRLLAPMVRRSDNVTATRIRDIVTDRGLKRLGVPGFRPRPIWGMSTVSARGMSKFMLTVDRRIPPRHRTYGLRLLGTIVRSQRWGIARVRPRGWRLYFKGGWGSGSGAVDHQVALLTNGHRRVSIAVMTTGNGSHAAGKATLRGVSARLLRGLERTAG